MERIKMVLVDDHRMVRFLLREWLKSFPEFEVIGEADTHTQAQELLENYRPHVLCLELSVSGNGGFMLLEWLQRLGLGTRTLVWTHHDHQPTLRAALATGATGYLLKRSEPHTFVEAIRAVHRGEVYIDPLLRNEMDDARSNGKANQLSRLSDREREVLGYLAQGNSYQSIAERMGVSIKTVETYRTRLGVKLGIRNRADLMRLALDAGILKPYPSPMDPPPSSTVMSSSSAPAEQTR